MTTGMKRNVGLLAMSGDPQTPVTSPSPAKHTSPYKRIKTETSHSPTETNISNSTLKVIDNLPFSKITFINVGPDQVRFGLHEEVLGQVSAFFRNALNIDLEARQNEDPLCNKPREIDLPSEDPAIFKRFTTWVYTRKLCTAPESPKDLPWDTIIDTYKFAERRGIPKLKNKCIRAIIRKAKPNAAFPNQEIVNSLWKTSGAVWPLRLLFLDLFAARCDLKAALGRNGGYHHRFLHDLVIMLYEIKQGQRERDFDCWKERKKYYVHAAEALSPLL